MCEFVNFSIAKKLKEKGFKTENTNWCYLDGNLVQVKKYINISPYEYAPTISQVLKWLREEKGWIIVVRLYSTNGWYWFIQDKNGELKSSHLASCDDCFATYELAALAGVNYCLDNLI